MSYIPINKHTSFFCAPLKANYSSSGAKIMFENSLNLLKRIKRIYN